MVFLLDLGMSETRAKLFKGNDFLYCFNLDRRMIPFFA